MVSANGIEVTVRFGRGEGERVTARFSSDTQQITFYAATTLYQSELQALADVVRAAREAANGKWARPTAPRGDAPSD